MATVRRKTSGSGTPQRQVFVGGWGASSAGAGIWKPHPDAYHHVAGRLGTRPADTALVAVHPWDVQGAVRAGLVGAWVNRSGAEWPTYFDEPDVRGASLGKVASRLTSGELVTASTSHDTSRTEGGT